MSIRAFIFDLDGTLVDALPDIHANINAALAACGHAKRVSLEEVRPLVGGGAQNLAAKVLGLSLDHPETLRLYHTFTEIYAEHPAEHGRPFPGVVETLSALKARGVPLACVTAKPAKAREKVLEAMGLAPFLDVALSPEDGYAKKPAPDMLLAAAQRMQVPIADTAMVGDTDYDLEAGLRAGCGEVCWVAHGYQPLSARYRGRVRVVKDFKELLKLADGHASASGCG